MPSLEKYGPLALLVVAAACADTSSSPALDTPDAAPKPAPVERPIDKSDVISERPVAEPKCASAVAGDSDSEVLKTVQADYAGLDALTQSQTLYVTVSHLTEGKSECEVNLRRYGIGVALNMVSRAPKIVAPTFIDEKKHVARVDVRELTWTPESIAYLFTISSYHDYGVLSGLDGGPALVRADWLSQHLTRPPVYGYMVRAELTERLIEAQAGATEDLTKPRVFGGVYESGVALYPRILERRDSDFGVCWISHDFLYRPQAIAVMESGQLPQDDLRFGMQQYIAREYICSLPNGLHEYNLTGFVSQRRWDAGGCVAKNRSREDELVLNGQCFNCHTNGWLPFKDKVRGGVDKPSKYITDHYPLQEDLDALFAKDQALFEAATKQIPYYDSKYTENPLNTMIAEYGARSGDKMREPEGGTFGAILPRSGSAGPVWEQLINPIASLAVDVGILLPVSVVAQTIPEYILPALEDKYRQAGVSEDVGCFNPPKVPAAPQESDAAVIF
ncbi:MAG: hypothetical protein ABW352_15885 [Polyangiales bacterium]